MNNAGCADGGLNWLAPVGKNGKSGRQAQNLENLSDGYTVVLHYNYKKYPEHEIPKDVLKFHKVQSFESTAIEKILEFRVSSYVGHNDEKDVLGVAAAPCLRKRTDSYVVALQP